MTIRLAIRFVLLAGLVSAASLSAGCDSSRTTVQEILGRTIPPGDSVPTLSEPARSGQSLQFVWDFDTHLTPSEYQVWLKEHVRDFEVVQESQSRLSLATHIGGDAFRLLMTPEPGTGTTHIHAQLRHNVVHSICRGVDVTAAEAFDRLRPLATLRGEAHVDDERYDATGGIEAAVLTWL